ncbi:MAG: PH domain-containing protein [Candidatus Saccharimonadales bacterium]
MISLNQVEDQLKKVGCNFRFWGRPEIKELCNILIQGEVIAQAINGRYENGFAMLVVTDHRLLLIDKKPMFLTLEDIRFDMIAEIDFSAQLLDSTVKIITPNRTLVFTSWNQGRLRKALDYTQQRVSELRHHYLQQQFQPQQQEQQEPQFQRQRQYQRNEALSAPMVGELAIQGQGNVERAMLPGGFNPYTNMGLTMRKRRIPKFY